MLKPYKPCIGRKFKKEKLEKLKKPICCMKNSIINNYDLSEKNKMRFISQLFRWFDKDSNWYKINYFFKKKYVITDCDLINLSVKIQKAGWKKLLLKLGYIFKDYKKLKKRSYSLNFIFFFINTKDEISKELTIDITSNKCDIFNIFITLNSYFINDFYNIIIILKKKALKRKDKDENDYILEDLDYIYSWNRFGYNNIMAYEVYMPWYLTKENYNVQRPFKKKNERKYRCFIKEKKLNGLFPLKKVKSHLIVTDSKKKDSKKKFKFWKVFLEKDSFKKKTDFFKEIKRLIKIININCKINPIIVYLFIECLKE